MKNKKNQIDFNFIYKTIKTRILNKEYGEGHKLSENKLAIEFNVSRTPIREVINHLVQENLVEVIAHSGTYVKPITLAEYKMLTEIRASLESLAVTLIIEQNNVDLKVLDSLVLQLEDILKQDSIDFVKFGEIHYKFHLEMVKLSNNTILLDTYKKLNLQSSRMMFYQKMNKKDFDITQGEHKKIVQMLKNRNPRVSKFSIMHLWKKRNKIVQLLS